jgi:hypothetical protein
MVVMTVAMLVEKLVLVMMKWSVGMLVQSKAGLMAVLKGVGKEEMTVELMVVMMVEVTIRKAEWQSVDWKEEKMVELMVVMSVEVMVQMMVLTSVD